MSNLCQLQRNAFVNAWSEAKCYFVVQTRESNGFYESSRDCVN